MHIPSNINYPLLYVEYNLSPDFPVTELSKEKLNVHDQQIDYLHYHNLLEIGYCYEGEGIFFVNDKMIPYCKGDVSIIFRNQFHIARSNNGFVSKWDFIMLDPVVLLTHLSTCQLAELLQIAQGNKDFINILKESEHPHLIQLIREILNELAECKDRYESSVRGLVWAMMMKLGRILSFNSTNVEAQDIHMHILNIAPALNYITTNYTESITVDRLALLCHTSVSTFNRRFKGIMNTTPIEYLIQVRIKMASIQIRETHANLLEISQNVGFNSLSSFNRHFKRIVGMSPREWNR